MIQIIRADNTTNQKMVGNFLKRVKKTNMIARSRKTTNYTKPLAKLAVKVKAVRKAKYIADLESKLGGKI